jgi:adenylate cyclase
MESQDRLPRRLAAILYADVAGYSRLTGADEDATHRRLSEQLDLVTGQVERHGGRVMHFAGDAVLAMFEAVVDALLCAAHIQRSLETVNADLPDERKVQFRIGVNVGDVIEDRDDIYGDGVNVAARLESLANPGGICISESVHTAVGEKLPLTYEDLGEQEVKNIAKPVRAYRAQPTPDVDLPARWAPDIEPATAERTAVPLPDKPSIAVLPFDNFNKDGTDEFIADGLTEDLITALARQPDLFVIARNSTFRYKGHSVQMQEIQRDLGARYMVEGSVRSSGETLRVNAQLIDVENGAHLWAEKYDRPRDDLFLVQDELVDSISALVLPSVRTAEKRKALRKPTDELTAYELFVRARTEKHKLTTEALTKSINWLNRALELDANFAEAHALLALSIALLRLFTGSSPETYEQSLARVRKALEIDANQSLGYQAMSQILVFTGRYDESAEAGFRGIQINPNDAENHIVFSRAASTVGRYREAVDSAELAVKLNPFYPKYYPFIYGRALYADDQVDRAAEVLMEGMMRQPYLITGLHGVAALAHLGRIEDARNLTDEVLKMSPKLTLAVAIRNWGFNEAWLNDQFEADLRAGGVPEN